MMSGALSGALSGGGEIMDGWLVGWAVGWAVVWEVWEIDMYVGIPMYKYRYSWVVRWCLVSVNRRFCQG